MRRIFLPKNEPTKKGKYDSYDTRIFLKMKVLIF